MGEDWLATEGACRGILCYIGSIEKALTPLVDAAFMELV